MNGALITFEGIEGVGKSTQIRRLEKELSRRKIPVCRTREPGGTTIGNRIRRLLTTSAAGEMSTITELLLFAAARRQHVDQVIRPALETGTLVICDRFTDSTLAYQGGGRGLPRPLLEQVNFLATGDIAPDLTFYLDLTEGEGEQRVNMRLKGQRRQADRIELESRAFFRRVRNAYLELAAQEPGRFVVMDARKEVAFLGQNILEKVLDLAAGKGIAAVKPGI